MHIEVGKNLGNRVTVRFPSVVVLLALASIALLVVIMFKTI